MKFGSKILAGIIFFALTATIASAQNVPAIIVQPTSQATAPSGTISFTVSASGADTLVYQWAKNTTNLANGTFSGRATISGATSSILTLANITTNDQANYTCRITNNFGSITSSIASLTVYIAPTITTQPIGRTNAVGTNVSYTVVSSGSAPLSYQWKYNNSNIPSANLNVYTINNVTTNDSGNYSVIVSNPAGTANSSTAQLLILHPVVITTQPTSTTVLLNNPATFTVSASGSLLTYQWYNGYEMIAGATNSSYTTTNTQYYASGRWYNDLLYWVYVNNPLDYVPPTTPNKGKSSYATLHIIGRPIILDDTANQTTSVGSNITFSVIATAGDSPVNYQWFNTNSAIANQTNDSITLNNVQPTDSGSSYYVIVTNSYGSVTSSIAMLNVDYTNAIAPHGMSIVNSSNAGVTVQFQGTPNFNYAIQATTNLASPINWQPIFTKASDTNGNWIFTDSNTVLYPARFYRAIIPQ